MIELDPEDPQAHYNLAEMFYDTGDLPAAEQECRETLRIDPIYFRLPDHGKYLSRPRTPPPGPAQLPGIPVAGEIPGARKSGRRSRPWSRGSRRRCDLPGGLEKGRNDGPRTGHSVAVQLVGERISRALHLPIPGNVLGMGLLLAALVTGLVRLEWVRRRRSSSFPIWPCSSFPPGWG